MSFEREHDPFGSINATGEYVPTAEEVRVKTKFDQPFPEPEVSPEDVAKKGLLDKMRKPKAGVFEKPKEN